MKTNPTDAAFASRAQFNNEKSTFGLTKREYFAALAMQGVIASIGDAYPSSDLIAQISVEIADALIEELNNEK